MDFALQGNNIWEITCTLLGGFDDTASGDEVRELKPWEFQKLTQSQIIQRSPHASLLVASRQSLH